MVNNSLSDISAMTCRLVKVVERYPLHLLLPFSISLGFTTHCFSFSVALQVQLSPFWHIVSQQKFIGRLQMLCPIGWFPYRFADAGVYFLVKEVVPSHVQHTSRALRAEKLFTARHMLLGCLWRTGATLHRLFRICILPDAQILRWQTLRPFQPASLMRTAFHLTLRARGNYCHLENWTSIQACGRTSQSFAPFAKGIRLRGTLLLLLFSSWCC